MKPTPLLMSIFVISGSFGYFTGDAPANKHLTHADVAYGPHERNVLDFWEAEGDGPRPLVVFIHGGGWTQGEKSRGMGRIRPYLDAGISFAAINYRLTGEAPLPAPVYDAARAIQFLRSKADEWNIDPDRIAVTGGSAGGCTSLWLAFHEDLAAPDAEDPVLRESTRVAAAAVGNAQTAIDPKIIEDWIGPNVLRHRMIWTSLGQPNMATAMENYEELQPLYEKFSPYHHLTADDPPVMLTYGHPMTLPAESAGHGIHHPMFGIKLKEKSDQLGHECHVLVRDGPNYSEYDSHEQFLIDKLLNGD